MFIGRYFIPRRIAILIGAALTVVIATGGFFALQAAQNTLNAAPEAAVVPSYAPSTAPAPTQTGSVSTETTAPSSPGPSPTTAPSGEPDECGGLNCPTKPATPVTTSNAPSSGPPISEGPQYDPDTEVVSVIDVAVFEGNPDEKLWVASVSMWRQVLLLAQTNARPERILESDLDIIAARLVGATWETKDNKIVYTAGGEPVAVYLCLPTGPSREACTVAPS